MCLLSQCLTVPKVQVLAKAFEPLTKTYLRAFQKAGETNLRAIDTPLMMEL